MAKQPAPPSAAPTAAPAPPAAAPAAPPPADIVPPVSVAQRMEQARFASALANVTTDVHDGTNPVAPQPPQQRPVNLPPHIPWNPITDPTLPTQPIQPTNPFDDHAVLAHRAMLAEEERRLELLRARNPLPAIPDITPLPHSHLTGTQQRTLIVKEGADPLLVESYQVLATLVAGGVIAPAYDKSRVLSLMQKLEATVQYTAAAVVAPAASGEAK